MEDPKQWWKQYLKDSRGFKGATKKAFDNYETRYLKDDRNSPRAEDFKTKSLVPGKIYTFTYTGDPGNNPNEFMDKRPVILSLGRTNIDRLELEGGINFNTMPHDMRLGVLDRIHSSYNRLIEVNEKNIAEGKNNPKPLPINYELSTKLFSGMGIETSFYVYDRKKMKDIKIFDYSDWISIVALNTKGIIGKPLNQIWEEYIRRMNKKINRLEEIKESMNKK